MKPKTNRSPESVAREIERKTCRKFNPEKRIRIILEGLKGDTMREANSDEVSELRKENEQLKQLVAELSLKNRVLKKV
jgi:transposase